MNDEQERIEEMAKQMCGARDNSCIHDCTPACGAREYAKRCFKAGYRKASEVIDEFESRLSKSLACQTDKFGLADLKYVVAEMRQEVEKWEKK